MLQAAAEGARTVASRQSVVRCEAQIEGGESWCRLQPLPFTIGEWASEETDDRRECPYQARIG